MAKKTKKTAEICDPSGHGADTCCKGPLAILIIVLVWISAATWSKVVITIAAALILIGSMHGFCKTKKLKK